MDDWKVWQMVVLIGCCCMDPHFDTDHDSKKLNAFFLELMEFFHRSPESKFCENHVKEFLLEEDPLD